MVKLRTDRGYTLAEALMVVAIIGIVVLIGPKTVISVVKFYQLHSAKVAIQRDARLALDIINRFLRQAKASTVYVDQATGQPPYSRISFTTYDGKNMMFYQSGNSLYQVYRSTTVLSKDLRYMAFTYPRSDDPTIISVALTMERATFQGASKALELSIEKVRIMN